MTGVNSSLHRLLWYLPMLGMAICYSVTSLPLRAADQIVVQLPWQHQFQFAGYYAAQFKGFYCESASFGIVISDGNRVALDFAHHGGKIRMCYFDFACFSKGFACSVIFLACGYNFYFRCVACESV